MTVDHALFFIFNGPQAGREPQAMEAFGATKAFWSKRKEAGDIAGFETVMLSSTGNSNMPAGFLLVTGERSKLQDLRWNDEEFLGLHSMSVVSMQGYACIDGYAGAGFDKHMERIAKLMKQ